MFDKKGVDYSLYLVTNDELVPEGCSFLGQVEKALENGCGIVQLREKDLDTRGFVERAMQVHELTRKYGVPLVINDRVDVALAIDAEGVHVGQDDMHFSKVRAMIGDDKIIGVSCSCELEVLEVVQSSAKVDYIGIGPVYDTATKKLDKIPFGTSGIRALLKLLRDNNGSHIKSVIIGGLNKTNIQRVLYTSSIPGKNTDGVAVVSCIMAEKDAAQATRDTLACVKELGPWVKTSSVNAGIVPMVHHITNDVVKNFSANITIAVGGSPIMSELDSEFEEFARIPNSALLLNTGTPTEDQIKMYVKAIDLYNALGSPIVYDPVGCAASSARMACLEKLLNQSYFSVIKGNSGEITAAAGLHSHMKGVDSDETFLSETLISAASKLALEQRCVVVVTGAVDYIVNGMVNQTSVSISDNSDPALVTVKGGHPLMGKVTGTGCSLGSVIATFVAKEPDNVFQLTVEAVKLYKKAGAIAGADNGPGTFPGAFLNLLYKLS